MHSGLDEMTRQRMLQAKTLSQEARGGLNLGKKISVPKDVMMEELNLLSNRGSRMFQERQRRAEKFTLENVTNGPYNTNVRGTNSPLQHTVPMQQGGKENQTFSIPGKHSLVMNLQKTVAKKGSPDVLAPDDLTREIHYHLFPQAPVHSRRVVEFRAHPVLMVFSP
ncbi:hypothetical protein GOODEAATRI_000568, partial [Goodea atripinnis]